MTSAEAWFSNSLRPWKPEGSLGRTAQDGHLDSHTAPELCINDLTVDFIYKAEEAQYSTMVSLVVVVVVVCVTMCVCVCVCFLVLSLKL